MIQSRLEHVTFDAAIVPTDHRFSVRPYWWPILDSQVHPVAPVDWTHSGFGQSPERADVWFVDVASGDVSKVVARLIETIRSAVDALALTPPKRKRARHLIATPLIGTAGGGQLPGEVVTMLVEGLEEIASGAGVDIALVVLSRRRYEGLQWKRRRLAGNSGGSSLVRQLGQYAREGNLSLMIGSGVSAAADLPNWNQLLEKLQGHLHKDAQALVKSKAFDRLAVWDQAELLQALLGEKFDPAIVEAVGGDDEKTKPALGHFLLAGLRCRQIATTNYDRLYENAVKFQGEEASWPVPVRLPDENPQLGKPWILKLHGDVQHGGMVLSRRSFVSFDNDRRAAGALLQSMLLTTHVLFVGVSMSDDNVIRLTHEVSSMVPNTLFGTVLGLGPDDVRTKLWEKSFIWEGIEAPTQIEEELGPRGELGTLSKPSTPVC